MEEEERCSNPQRQQSRPDSWYESQLGDVRPENDDTREYILAISAMKNAMLIAKTTPRRVVAFITYE
jgi:hypothetical protein